MYFDVDDEALRRAVHIRAAKDGMNTSEVVIEALKAFLPEELEEAKERIARGEHKPKLKK